MIVLLFINYVYTMDICRQLSTYEKCIASKTEYCRWFPNQHYCRQSVDLVQGCDSNLSAKLCMRQISTTMSAQALCIFDSICHPIYDSSKLKCSQNLNKYGCLGVSNKSQFCKWENRQCVDLTQDELSNINTIFPQLELSLSVCPLITGFLIVHSNIVQPFLTTQIEYALLAQEDESSTQTDYVEGTLQNNYINQNGQFVWFQPEQQQQYNLLQLQINDINRSGCIGIDISDDVMYRKLFNIQNTKILQGVNHIYCQYINTNPYIIQTSVFINNECQIVEQNVLMNRIDINCQQLGRPACQLTHPSLNCEVVQPLDQNEISCQYNANQIANTDCLKIQKIATPQKCSQSTRYCFFDFQDQEGFCDNGCYDLDNQEDCNQKYNCMWIEENSGLFINCSPKDGCTQRGLSQTYCINLALNCIWQDNQCQYGDLRLLTCEQANSKFSCVNVQRQDQLCIWYKNECVNTLTHSLFKNYYSLPEKMIRNKNQCVMQDKLFYRYNPLTKQCIQDFVIDTQNLENINKYFCLNLQLFTQWNYETQSCDIIQPNTSCDNRLNINPQLCSVFLNCIYDEINLTCQQYTDQLKCNIKGQQKEECISNLNELCQWKNKQCYYVYSSDTCSQLVNVSPLSCQLIQNERCQYVNNSCISSIKTTDNSCQQYMNQMSCQQQQNECYFDQYQCLQVSDNTLYQQLNCNGLSQQACIKSLKQKCIWNNIQCQIYDQQFFDVCDNFVNYKGCQAKFHQGKLYKNHFCQYDQTNNKCLQNNDIITDCGSNLIINIHRCMAYTQLECFYQNNQCQQLSSDSEHKLQELQQLNCDQVNVNVCQQIVTQDQICILIDRISFKYCINIAQTSLYSNVYSCSDLNTKLKGNINICSIATDKCYYNSSTNQCEVQSDVNVIYECDDIISKTLCLTQTINKCIFVNNQCKYYSNSYNNILCNVRNQYSCENSGRNCQWDTTNLICIESNNYCVQQYNINPNICSNGIGKYFSGQGGCIESPDYNNLPCNIGLSEQLCIQQQQICLWINNRCIEYPYQLQKCSQADNINECLAIQHLNCIYYKNQCIDDNTGIEQSDYYQNESYQYCLTHPYNVYLNSQMCVQLFGAPNNQDFDQDNTFNMQCKLANSMITCIHQRSLKCTFLNQKCYLGNLKSCDQAENVFHSPQVCHNIDNCYWHTNKQGQGFCYQNALTCENLTLKSLCLSDMGLNCMYVNNKCQQAQFTDCDSVQNKQINYSTCQQLQPNCFYDFQNKLCKKITRVQVPCAQTANLYDCVFSFKNQCQVQYNGNDFSSCVDITNLIYNEDNNYYACTQLIDDFYIYSLKTYKCIKVTDSIDYCYHSNQKTCLQKTTNLQCIWLNNECTKYKQNLNLNCNQLNQQVCLLFAEQPCIWLNNQCVLYTGQTDSNILYSQGYCQSINQLWFMNKCHTYNNQLALLQCDNMGLSKEQCLNQDQLECYWSNFKCSSLLENMDKECGNISKYNCESDQFFCIWSQDKCIDNKDTTLQCEQYSFNSCIQLSNNDCVYDEQLGKCQSVKQKVLALSECNENLSFQLCKQVQNQICLIYDLICQQWTPRLFDCMYIQNYYGCMYAPISCQWSNNQCLSITSVSKFLCQNIPNNYNKHSCSEFSVDPCQFDDKLLQCTNKIIYTTELVDVQFLDDKALFSIDCSKNQSFNDCMIDFEQECEWKDNQCISSTLQYCDNQNYQSCLNNNGLCKWRNGKCYQFDNQSNKELIPSLVSQSVCIFYQTTLALKYDYESYSCILSNQTTDDCDTIGLNEQGCYQILKSQCYFDNGCKFYTLSNTITTCSQVVNINAKVCQNLLIPCKYLNKSCIEMSDTDLCTENGLSKLACIEIKTQPCYWDGNQCNKFIADNSIDQCDNHTLTNSLSCQLIDYLQQPCIYDSFNNVCQKQFNRFSQCSTPGLNKYACFAIELESCKFQSNQCKAYANNADQCYSIRNANAYACSQQTTQKCTYQQSSFSCVGVPLKIPCDSKGINSVACALQVNCKWNYDTLKCVHKTTQYINQCYNSDKDTCISLSNCFYDNNVCRLKRCRDYSKNECLVNLYLNNEVCYLDQNNQCQIAQKCEDIVFLNEQQKCSQFFFGTSSCFQINNYCIQPTQFDQICPHSDCQNTNCIQTNGLCRVLVCSDYLTDDSCPNNNCAFINGICQQITTCSDVNNQDICNLSKVNNEQCSWQPSALRYGDYYCTSKPCYLFGSSWSFCQNNEMNDQACFVTDYAQCESCEEQTDKATCLNQKICQFVNNQCKSILCKYFNEKQTCIENSRCYWSSQDSICRKSCTKIVEQAACDALDYECNWNFATYTCQSGAEYNLDLTITVDETDAYQNIIKIMLIIIYLYL